MSHTVRFGVYEADLDSGQLRKHGIRIKLRDQSFQVLNELLQHPGQVVSRDELRQRLWGDEVIVDFENNLNTAVAHLRQALGDSADHPRFIETMPKRGYRFLPSVSGLAQAQDTGPVCRTKILVLPFLNLSGDATQDYFSDAVTDEIITELAALAPEQLAVIARTTAMLYKNSHQDIAAIGRDLGVDYVVEGAVRRNGEQVGINVQLIETRDQTHLFGHKYDAALHDIFAVQRTIARAVAERIPVAADQARIAAINPAHGRKKPTEDLAAYNEYIQGRSIGLGTPHAFADAKLRFENAIARDPEFADAHDALAELHWYMGYFGMVSPRQAFSAGIVHAVRALEIDNSRAETHALLAQFHKTVEYNWPEVQREMELALRLDPNSPLVRMRYAVSFLMPHGRLEEAARELECALEYDPLSLLARMWLGVMLVLAGRFHQAIEEGRKILDINPTFGLGHFVIGIARRYCGNLAESIAALQKSVEITRGASVLGWLGMTLADAGRKEEAREILRRLHAMEAQGYVPPSSLAWVHLGLGETDKAFEWMGRAVDECDQLMMPIQSYHFLNPIRSDPRFSALLRRMNLER